MLGSNVLLLHCTNLPISRLRVGLIQALDLALGFPVKVKDLFWIVVFGGAALFAYDKYTATAADVAPQEVAIVKPPAQASMAEDRSWIKPRENQPNSPAASSSKCDGRASCPQMTSCAEAKYFIAHCPNTKMDGDRDGIPCEEQWCS